MNLTSVIALGGATVAGAFGFSAIIAMLKWRRVVPTNEVHTVQYADKTVAYGKDQPAGNSYMEVPTWLPRYGCSVITMPTSIFDIDLPDYVAYDVDRVPFIVAVKGFFKVSDPEVAAQRVYDFEELHKQLEDIVKGAIRSILANAPLQAILGERSVFGDKFTAEVSGQLTAWGVQTVKNIELMDIRDAQGSDVISNIMEKKKSEIEKESRIEVAKNKKEASAAEISADREIVVKKEEAARLEGEARAERERLVGLKEEESRQAIAEQAAITAERNMAVRKIEEERQAEIDKQVAITLAEQEKEEAALKAEAKLIEDQKAAQGIAAKFDAEASGIAAKGKAEAEAKKALEMAPVEAQLELAKGIAQTPGYTDYLLGVKKVEADEKVGLATADAIADSNCKIIVNGGDVASGISTMSDLLSPKGGTAVAGMVSALKNNEDTAETADKLVGDVVSAAKTAAAATAVTAVAKS